MPVPVSAHSRTPPLFLKVFLTLSDRADGSTPGVWLKQGGPGMPPGQPGTSGPPNGTGGKDDSYFTESRKGEVNELRTLLRTFGTEKDRQRKRDIMKKVRYNGQQDQTSKPKSVGPDSYAR